MLPDLATPMYALTRTLTTATHRTRRWEHSHLAPLSAVSYLPSFAVNATAKLLSAVTRGQQYAQGAAWVPLRVCLTRAVLREGGYSRRQRAYYPVRHNP